MSDNGKIHLSGTVFGGAVVLAVFVWFLWRNRIHLTMSFVVRHLAFNLCVYLGMLWFVFQDSITVLIFGHIVAKGSSEELPATVVILGGVLAWFAVGAVVLGRNRKVEFGRYREAFKLPRRPKK